MRISTFFYTIKQGLVNIWKNKMFSLASIATMTACIFLFGLFYSIVTNFQAILKMFILMEMKMLLQVLQAIIRLPIQQAIPFI